MKLITGLLITGTLRFAFCQPMTSYNPTFESCDKAIEQANIDAKAGILRSITHGLVLPNKTFELERFYENYMITKFGIESFNPGCIVEPFEECYSDEMHTIIKDKYGPDFFTRIERTIKSEFEIFNKLEYEQRKQYINFDFTYKVVDRKADYNDGFRNLFKEVHKKLDFSKLDLSPYPYKDVIGIYLVIGQTGTIDKCQVVSKDFPKAQAEKIENTIKAIGNWRPASLYGYDVKSELLLAFPLVIN
jgi:hypothetical protein